MKCWPLVLSFSMLVGISALSTPAAAQTKTLSMQDRSVDVWVFRDGAAMDKFAQLVNAHVTDPELFAPLVSCFVASGTKVIVTDGGFFFSTVLVVDGPEKGCQGEVENEVLKD